MTGGKRVQSIFQTKLFTAALFVTVLFLSGPSSADWEIYVSGGLGISAAIIDTDGVVRGAPDVPLSGEDSDSSPLIDAAVGLKIPMDEIVPREWLMDIRLPDWPVRFELEASGLREFELETDQNNGTQNFFTTWTATTSFVNGWIDIPLTEMWRPIQYLGGLGRQPRLRQWLEPGSFFLGSGIGFSYLEIDGTSNVLSGSDKLFAFAWNVGAGFNYALTESVDISTGYRYVGLGEQEVDIKLSGVDTGDQLTYTPQVHEFRVQLRVEVFDFLSPWR